MAASVRERGEGGGSLCVIVSCVPIEGERTEQTWSKQSCLFFPNSWLEPEADRSW